MRCGGVRVWAWVWVGGQGCVSVCAEGAKVVEIVASGKAGVTVTARCGRTDSLFCSDCDLAAEDVELFACGHASLTGRWGEGAEEELKGSEGAGRRHGRSVEGEGGAADMVVSVPGVVRRGWSLFEDAWGSAAREPRIEDAWGNAARKERTRGCLRQCCEDAGRILLDGCCGLFRLGIGAWPDLQLQQQRSRRARPWHRRLAGPAAAAAALTRSPAMAEAPGRILSCNSSADVRPSIA
eukprot:357924-Chlamydomonas_euryale.AAC.10